MSLVNLNAKVNSDNNFFGNYRNLSCYQTFMQPYQVYNNNYSVLFRNNNSYYNNNEVNSITERAVKIAEMELAKGIKETSKNDSIDIRKYKKGARNSAPWCASFVSYLYGDGQNSSNSKTFGYTASSQDIKAEADEAKCFASKNSGYIPQKGDIAVWTNVGNPNHGHVGIVVESDKLGFWVIEGNSSNRIKKNYYSYASLGKRFSGWAQMSKWLNSNKFEAIG